MDGVIIVDKPRDWTSHDVVNKMRRLAGTKKVGHLGTLDPSATGVLPLVIERATRLAQLAQQGLASNQVNDTVVGRTAAFWHDVIPQAPSYKDLFTGFSGNLMAVLYDLYYKSGDSYVGNEVVGLGNLDIYSGLGDNNGSVLFFNNPGGVPMSGDALNNQATSMYGWSSIGDSSYNGLQASLRKQFGSGVQFDLNYTYSKSLTDSSGNYAVANTSMNGSTVQDSYNLKGDWGPSGMDIRHSMNFVGVYHLPYGHGQTYGGSASGVLDASLRE